MRGAQLAAALGAAALAAVARTAELPPPRPPITFADVTQRAGIRFKFQTDLKRRRMIATMGGGVAMGDCDGDGFLDLLFTGSAASGKRPEDGPCGALYRNRGNGTFEDATVRSGIHACGWTMGAHWVDVFGTGRLDLLVTGLGKTMLFANQGNGTFLEVARERRLVAEKFAVGLAAGDVDGDGRVDLYVVNYLDTTYEWEMSFPQLQVRLPDDYEGQDAYLFVQREDGRFEERAEAAGVLNRGGRGMTGLFFDYDGDGHPDLYVTNDRQPNVLYRGNGDGTFADVTLETGAGARDQKTPRAGMGLAMADVDGDGHPDLLVTNFAGEPNTLYRNVEGALFEDASESSGVAAASLPNVQWGVDLVDFDNDGWPDALAVSGHLVPRMILTLGRLMGKDSTGFYGRGNRSYRQPPVLWRNLGAGRFQDATSTAADLATLRLAARGMAAGDVDGDGRVDVAIAAVDGGVRLLRNTTAGSGNVLSILPVAGPDGRTVLGTKVAVTAGGRRRVQEFVLRPAYASGSWVPLHFGLADCASAERVDVIPPGQTAIAQSFQDVPAGRLYELRAGELTVRRELR